MNNEENYDNYEDEDTEEEQSSGSKIQEIYYNNKKLIWALGIIIVFIIIAALFSGNGGGSDNDNSIVKSINNPEHVQVFKSKQLRVNIRGNEYSGAAGNIKWSSQNENIAAVDLDGMITGKSIGTTTIYGTYFENSNSYTFSFDVIVSNGNENVKLQNVDFNGRSLIINSFISESIGDKLNVSPDDGYVYNVTYRSSNPEIASVDDSGLISGVKEGHATITASVNDGTKEAVMDVYVNNSVTNSELIKVPEKIEFEAGNTFKIGLNESKELKLLPSPSDASSKFITWKSSDENVVNVTDEGLISGIKLGTATITATALNKKEGKLVVEVVESTDPIESISIVPSSITMNVGESKSLLPTVKPDKASNKALTFESSNTVVASVVPTSSKTSATIYAGSAGTAVITVKSDNGKTATVTVTVKGSGGSSTSPSGSSNDTGSIKLRLENSVVKDQGLNKSCDGSVIEYYKGPVKITISKNNGDVASVAYCYTKGCTPNKNNAVSLPTTVEIANSGTYILKVKKYNSNGAEIKSSNSGNYVDGSLVYYINTKQSGLACSSPSTWESGGSTNGTNTKNACYCKYENGDYSCTWAKQGSASFPTINNNFNTEAKCNLHVKQTCCHLENGKYVNSLTSKSNCVADSKCNNDTKNIIIDATYSVTLEKIGDTKEVHITLKPSPFNENVEIKSDKESVFTVSPSSIKSTGDVTLTATGVGTAKLIVRGGGIEKTLNVTVKGGSVQSTPSTSQPKTTPTLNVPKSVSIGLGLCKSVTISSNVKGRFDVTSANNSIVYIDNLSSSFSVTSNETKSVKLCAAGNAASDNVNVDFKFTPDDNTKYNSANATCSVTINRQA